jgi:hypothetical protein
MGLTKDTPETSATLDWQKVSRSIAVPGVPPLRYVGPTQVDPPPPMRKDGFCAYTAALVGLAAAAVAVSAYYGHTRR